MKELSRLYGVALVVFLVACGSDKPRTTGPNLDGNFCKSPVTVTITITKEGRAVTATRLVSRERMLMTDAHAAAQQLAQATQQPVTLDCGDSTPVVVAPPGATTVTEIIQ